MDLILRTALSLALLDVSALRAVCQRTAEACSANDLWEQLCVRQWAGFKTSVTAAEGGWKHAFFARVRRTQTTFLAKNVPMLMQRTRHKDGLPNLQKIHDALRLKYALVLGPPGAAVGAAAVATKTFHLSGDAVQVFGWSVCLRCSFTSVKFRVPLQVQVLMRSASLGLDRVSLAVCLGHVQAWGQCIASDENFTFLRSPFGRVLLAIWKTDGTVAGLFVTLHHLDVLRPLLEGGTADSAWQALAGRPESDDLDLRLGLHDYTVVLTLRTAKVEAFSNIFYRVDAIKESTFGKVQVHGECAVDQRGASSSSAAGGSPGRVEDHLADVAHFEVLAPHASGSLPPFPCSREPQLVFQTLAFRSTLSDLVFVDATVLDEHGRIMWAVSAPVALRVDVPPQDSAFAAHRFAAVDFDRDSDLQRAGESSVRWLCLAERGTAQLVVQLEYGTGQTKRPLPRLNAITWHAELAFLDQWWGSRYARGGVR